MAGLLTFGFPEARFSIFVFMTTCKPFDIDLSKNTADTLGDEINVQPG